MNLKAEINEVEKKFNAFNTKCMKIKCMAHLLLADNISTQMFEMPLENCDISMRRGKLSALSILMGVFFQSSLTWKIKIGNF